MLSAVTLISVTDLYSRALAEGGVRHTMATTHPSVLDTRLIVQDRPLGPKDYQRLRSMVDPTVESHLEWMLEDKQRYGRSQHVGLALPPDEVPREGGLLARGFFLTDFQNQVRLIEGRWPQKTPVLNDDGVQLEGAIGTDAAHRMRLSVGSSLYLVPFESQPSERIAITIVGTMEPIDIRDEYWMGYAGYFDLEGVDDDRFSLPVYLRQEDYLQGLGARFPFLVGEYGWLLYTDNNSITADGASRAIAALPALETEINKLVPRTLVLSGLDNTLVKYQRDLTLFRIPVFLFLYLLVAVILYFLFLAMGILAQTRRDEASLLRSRGASSLQLNSLLLVSDGILVLVAVGLGPLLALLLANPLLSDTLNPQGTKDSPIALGFSSNMFLLAGIGGAVTFGLIIVQSLNLTRLGIVQYLRERARPPSLPWLQRYYLDFVVLALIGLVWWQVHGRSGFVTKSLVTGALEAEPTLLLGPVLAFIGVILLIFRLLPLFARAVNRLADMVGPAWISVAFRRVAREPLPYALMTVMLILASGLSIYAATFQGTLSRSTKDRALYSLGGDLVVMANGSITTEEDLQQIPQISTISPIHRASVRVSGKPGTPSVQLLGLDSSTLAGVSWFREDFADASLPELVEVLAPRSGPDTGLLIPRDAESLGLWARMDTPGLSPTLWVRLRDGRGKYHSLALGKVTANDWGLIETPLITSQGPLEPPIRLVSIQTRLDSRLNARVGSISMDDISVTTPSDPNQRTVIQGFEVFNPWVPIPGKGVVADTLEQTTRAARSGRGGLKFSWAEPMSGEPRGLLVPPGSFPLTALGSPPFFPGEKIHLIVDDLRVPIVINGVLDYFPSVDPTFERFLLVEAEEYREYLQAITDSTPQEPQEFWLKLSEGADRELALSTIRKRIDAESLVLDSQHSVQQAQHDPLGGGSWQGLAILSVITLAASVAITLILQGAVSVQSHRIDLVVLRVLGLSGGLLRFSLAVELALVSFLGILVGSVTGLLLAIWSLGRVDITSGGLATVPPLVVTFQPWLMFTIFAVLFATSALAILVTSLLANRLQTFEVLRLGQ